MNRSEILSQVYDAILHRPTNTGVHWYLCWQDHKIQCLPMSHLPKPEFVFDCPTTNQFAKGYNSSEWSRLEAKIYTFLKDRGYLS